MGPTVLYVIGIVFAVAGIFKAAVLGFYESDLPLLLSLLIGGAVLITIAKKWGERV
ncbi:putative membrane protein [Terracoccus luteus]|uniref:Putative membrane protein n=2 Tax=Terracoccus luteus TaxID=53356 RepID=A0A839PVK1_9MICO|nr:hypothetical protein [Terracoccus luteus]MBB2988140.1 putative membrane protein [Terracoccus luteus]MCP2173775.1 putative membrane protein [Terracoccus luteus]